MNPVALTLSRAAV